MMSSLNIHNSKTRVRPCESYSIDFHGENSGMLPVEPYVDVFENIYTSPTFTNASNYDTSFSSNVWAGGAPVGLDPHFAADIYSPPIPTHYISTALISSSTEIDPTPPDGWQFEAGSFIQKNPGMPWWWNHWTGFESDEKTSLSSKTLKTDNSSIHIYKPESISVSESTTVGAQHGDHTDLVYHGPPCKKKKGDGLGLRQETIIKGSSSASTAALMYSSEAAASSIPSPPAVSFDPPATEAQVNQRRSRSLRGDISSSDKRRARQSPIAATSLSELRARNRIAAYKCRVKTKATVAELEATERRESSRHEQLSMILRSLQEEVFVLKSKILTHGNCSDQLIQDYLNKSARSLTARGVGAGEGGSGDGSHISSSESMQSRS